MKSFLPVVCLIAAFTTLPVRAQLFTFAGQVNFSIGLFEGRFAPGDPVTGYIDFVTPVQFPTPNLILYDARASVSIAGHELFRTEHVLASMENHDPGDLFNYDGWMVDGWTPIAGLDGHYVIQMTNFQNIMSSPANPPNGIPIDSFYNALGLHALFTPGTFVDPVADVRWDITSYHVDYRPPFVPVPEPAALSISAAAGLIALAALAHVRRKGQPARCEAVASPPVGERKVA